MSSALCHHLRVRQSSSLEYWFCRNQRNSAKANRVATRKRVDSKSIRLAAKAGVCTAAEVSRKPMITICLQ
jgi:hypothetical protein